MMRKSRKTCLEVLTIAAGCAFLLSVPVFATEAGKPSAIVNSITKTTEEGEVVTDVMISVSIMECYDDLAEHGIVSAETVKKMNEFSEQQNQKVEAEVSRRAAEWEESGKGIYTTVGNDDYSFNSMDEMVKEGIITQQEKDKIEAYYKAQMVENLKAEAKECTDRYVKEQIITKETAEKMISHVLEQQQSSGGVVTRTVVVTDVTVGDRADSESGLIDQISVTVGSVFDLDGLVQKGIITAAQKTAIEISDQNHYKSQS